VSGGAGTSDRPSYRKFTEASNRVALSTTYREAWRSVTKGRGALSSFTLRLTEVGKTVTTVWLLSVPWLLLICTQESDPVAMLCRVLMLVAVIVPMAALALLWWLA
jgi:hypothetical protein